MMKLRRAGFALLTLLALAWASAAPAQLAATSPALAAATDDFGKENTQMAQWFGRGFYDDIVNRADELLGENGRDPRLLYWRGMAFYRLGWFPEAIADLTRAQKAGVSGIAGGVAVAPTLDKIAQMQALTPPNFREIRNGNQVVFRVHYGALDSVTRGIIERLPRAYRVSAAMFGSDTLATSVYIFDNYPQFRAFYMARSGKPPGSWVAAAGDRDAFYFSLQRPDGSGAAERDPLHLESTIPHEFNHAMLRRLMGTTPLPRWFEEGLAQVAGGQVVTRDLEMNDYTIQRLFAAKALVAPQLLESSASFGAHTETGARMDRAGAGIAAPSPYAQSYSMTRYLLANMKRDRLPDFLNRVRDQGDFARAFEAEFGATLPQFYQSWYGQMARTKQ